MNRVVPGVLMAAGCIALLLWGSGNTIRFVLLLVGVIGLKEYFRMTCPYLAGLLLQLSILTALLPLLGVFSGSLEAVIGGLVICFMVTIFISLKQFNALPNVLNYITATCFGALYISVCLAYLALIQTQKYGSFWLLVLLALTAGSDTGAYYIGRKFGNKKLLPRVSPKKTIAGGIGGLCTGTLAAVAVSLFLPIPEHLVRLLPAAFLLIIMGVVGDLAESVIKRSCNSKDSGTILGGHGGLLDRIDSLLLAGPTLYYLLAWRVLQ
ncbi:MAG: hypothetical protein CSA32_02240 [Desulfobulbus propionicus]|nr:MAG: hypothetical protein CSA32_02240 [Desulfobulbus propionicus]